MIYRHSTEVICRPRLV